MIAVDVDGTLLNSAHELSGRVRRAVRAARSQGVHVALATGKLLRSVAGLVEALDLDGPQITCNGAAIMDAHGGEPLAFWPMEAPALARALAVVREADPELGIAWYTCDDIMTDAPPGPLDDVLEAYHEPPLTRVDLLDDRLPPPAKLLVTGAPERLARLRANVTAPLAGVVQVVSTTPDFLEFLSLTANKGLALRAIMRRLDLVPADTLALGDGENDIPLLRAAGCAVAMANAVPALRAHAHCHTRSNDEDGVAVVVEAVVAGHTGQPCPPRV